MLFKITFHLDGSGLHFNPAEPIHFDALLAWCLAPRQGIRDLQRHEVPPYWHPHDRVRCCEVGQAL